VSVSYGLAVVYAVTAAVFVILPSSTSAQDVGVKIGANSASLTPEEDEDPEMARRLGLVGGLWLRIPGSPGFSFQAEGLFSEKGVKVRVFGFDDWFDLRIRYFEMPLLARRDFGAPGAAARAFVTGGVAPAFKLSAHSTAVVQGEEQTRDVDDEVYSVDVGLVGGVGIAFRRALIEARYTHGIRHINTDDNGDEDRIKNRVFSVTAGFRFR
jgi:hypothetical protein